MSQEHPLRIDFLIHDVSRLRRTVADKALKPLGITRSQSWVLAFLNRNNGAGISQSDLADQMHVSKMTLGGLIDRLVDSGHVQRRKDEHDRRAYVLFLTKSGRSLIKKMQKVSEDLNKSILAAIPDKDVVVAEQVLASMKERLLTMDAVLRSEPSGKIVGG